MRLCSEDVDLNYMDIQRSSEINDNSREYEIIVRSAFILTTIACHVTKKNERLKYDIKLMFFTLILKWQLIDFVALF